MSLESATTISGLQVSNPTGDDPQSQGDDHIRLIKAVLKNIFPGALGFGFAIPITTSEVELNYVQGVTGSIQTQLTALTASIAATAAAAAALIPSGTRVIFCQAAAPVGWTQITTYNDYMLRVVNGAGGGAGGNMSPTFNNMVTDHAHGFATNAVDLNHNHNFTTGTESAAHTHAMNTIASGVIWAGQQPGVYPVAGGQTGTESANHTHSGATGYSNQSLVHAHSGTTYGVAGAGTWTPRYIDTIICSKN
jgi:hypothetical protein